MILKSIGAPLSLYEEVTKRSAKYKACECCSKWRGFNRKCHTIGSLFVIAKDGNPNPHERVSPNLHKSKQVFFDDVEYPLIEIDTPS